MLDYHIICFNAYSSRLYIRNLKFCFLLPGTHLYGGNLNRAYNCEETHLTYTTCTCSNCSPPPSYNEVMNNTCYQTTNIVHTFTSSPPDIVT